MADFNLAVVIIDSQTAKFNSPPNFPAIRYTVEPPNKGHLGNGPLVLCSEVVPILEVHDFSIHFDCIILNKLVNALKYMIRAVEVIIKWLVYSVFSVNIAQAEFFVSEVLATPKSLSNIIIAHAA